MDDGPLILTRHKLDVDAYYRMAEAGILGPEDRVELIDGEIIDMAPIGDDHAASVNVLNRNLVLACADQAIVSVQNPLRLDRANVPQPDLVLFKPHGDFYRTQRATPADVLVVIEVADSSLRFDRDVKLPLYARSGVPEFWLVDLKRRVLEVHRDPLGDRFATVTTHRGADRITPALAPTIAVPLDRLFD